MDVAVLGCGPAGLMAAHAATIEGHEVSIFSIRQKSQLGGAQYLHRHIEGITEEDPELGIRYAKFGDAETYTRKVYGFTEDSSSFDKTPEGWIGAWNLSRAYDRLWGIYKDRIHHEQLHGEKVGQISPSFELVISSVPAPAVCYNSAHSFNRQGIYLVSAADVEPNTVLYSGRMSEPWYRQSNIEGAAWTEYSTASMNRDWLNAAGFGNGMIRKGIKPTGHNCDCHPWLLRVGRFGEWKRGVLTHHAFEKTLDALTVARAVDAR